jgi:hypothetical protein
MLQDCTSWLIGGASIQRQSCLCLVTHLHCFPIKIAFAKHAKSLYQLEDGDFFAF